MKVMALVVTFLFSFKSFSKYSEPATLDIPTERLIGNIEASIKKDPNNKDLYFELARTYSLASVQEKIRVLPKEQSKIYQETHGNGGVKVISWYNGEIPASSNVNSVKASNFLKKSVEVYSKAIALNPNDMRFYLGRGWASLQLKDDRQAKKDLFYIIDQVKYTKSGPQNGTVFNFKNFTENNLSVIFEATEYLKQRYSNEDPELRKKLLAIRDQMPIVGNSGISPVIIPLDHRHKLEALIAKNNFVLFDLDGEGPKKWQWIRPNAGFLVFLGENKKNVVTSGRQLFGNVAFWIFWNNGYEALSALDDNQDGYLSAQELVGIFVWQDKNSDGVCDHDEILTLESLKIKKIYTQHQVHESGIEFNDKGVELIDRSFIPSYDWISRTR